MVLLNNSQKPNAANGGGADIKFIIRRFMKFYSGYWVILAICLPIGILLFDRPLTDSTSVVESAKIWIREIFAFSGHRSYNATWWFNALILSFYLLFPILYYGVKYSPILTLVISYILRHSVIMKISMDMGYYMFIFVVGIVLAVHYKSIQRYINLLPKWILWIVCVGSIIGSSLSLLYKDNDSIFYNGLTLFALLTLGLVLLIVLGIRKMKFVSGFFTALGKHSANIYLMHTLIFYYWFPNFFYSLKYPILIFSVLMVICFGISWVLEKAKDIVWYNKLTNMIIERVK